MDSPRGRLKLLANPVSGGGRAGELVPGVARAFEDQGYAVSVLLSRGPGEIRDFVRGLDGRGAEDWAGLVVLGGDGTVHEVVDGNPGAALPVLPVPVGSANVLATELRLPRRPDGIARVFTAGRTVLADTGRVTRLRRLEGGGYEAVDGHEPFLLMIGAGFDADLIEAVHRARGGGTLGKLRYVRPALGLWFRFRPRRHWAVFDDGRCEGPFAQVIVTNVRAYGGLWKLPGDPAMDDGQLDLCGFRARTRWGLLRHGLAGFLNLLRPSPRLHTERVRSVILDCEQPSRFQNDGDPGGACPIRVELGRRKLLLVVP